ncbi:uncharacterized protein LOC132756616 [Ruditapes philippinarum]|uniref:uncharacterized protein LOC132756616 n=1 Tax=Ruditapes philippinarum TaxID=129788 RepID=UPI00295AD729|nr:uncharacterized protein LOC132756616 [Ruditapes philippinarum]
MEKVIDSGAAEIAPPPTGKETWYLPIFGVYHPKKPDKIRGVFDSSAVCKGISLNSVLLSGPNSINSLLHILLRFRKDEIAVIADIEQMFYSFHVKLDHRDYLRFFWYRDNDTSKDLIEYRMCAHVFGNSPSPAVATYGLRKTVTDAEDDVKSFVEENFYVDDGLISLPETENVIDLVKRTQKRLQTANLRLHKIASNSKAVMKAFPQDDLQNDLRSLNFDEDMLPINRSLGLSWDLNTDNFKFNSYFEQKPYTRRGLLSTLNSVYDPLGFVSPLTIRGKLLLREITAGADWDEPLEPDLEMKWNVWKESLLSLDDLIIPRMFVAESLSRSNNPELHIFSDASEKAVSAVAYIRVCDKDNVKSVGFVMGKSKIAPSSGHTIPRLELCAALLAAEIGAIIVEALKVKFNTIKFYSDSRVVLGYICNTTRRFYNYVSNRIQKILQLSEAKQWNYINTKSNPADIGSRGCSSTDQLRTWLQGPEMLYKRNVEKIEEFSMIAPNEDKDVRAELTTNKTLVIKSLSHKFDRFSCWKRLVTAIVVLKRAIRQRSSKDEIEKDNRYLTASSEKLILKLDQERYYMEELKSLAETNHVNRNSAIVSLNPYLDNDGLIRVGGRLGQSCLQIELTNPIVLSGRSHIATLIIRYFHEKIKHQGRHLTEGAIRSNGYWIIGAKRLVSFTYS